MSKRTIVVTVVLIAAGALFSPAYAQEVANKTEVAKWSIITAGFALAFAAGLGALGQGRAIGSAVEAIARNPGAVGDIRGALLLGLVLIESLSIYVLLISLILFFLPRF